MVNIMEIELGIVCAYISIGASFSGSFASLAEMHKNFKLLVSYHKHMHRN